MATKTKAKAKAKKGRENVANGNLAKQTAKFWKVSYIHNQRGSDEENLTFEQAVKLTNGALQRLGPHRKVVNRIHALQSSMVVGAKPCRKKSKIRSNLKNVLPLIPRTQLTSTTPSS